MRPLEGHTTKKNENNIPIGIPTPDGAYHILACDPTDHRHWNLHRIIHSSLSYYSWWQHDHHGQRNGDPHWQFRRNPNRTRLRDNSSRRLIHRQRHGNVYRNIRRCTGNPSNYGTQHWRRRNRRWWLCRQLWDWRSRRHSWL